MSPMGCKRLAEVDFPMLSSISKRRGRSAVDVWGQRPNSAVEICAKHGVPPPVFEKKQGFLIPDKPRSRVQPYMTTEAGLAVIKDKTTDQGTRRGGDGLA
jgi:hypothetical protein